MGSRWLLDLPDWISAAGLPVDTYPGWETRSRSSGGYDAVLGLGLHHTAGSGRYPTADMKFMWRTSPIRPIGAIYLSRGGKITVGAAGATNTQGRGGALVASRGTIPRDAGNRFVLSIEAANPGDGTPWPDDQVECYRDLAGCLASRLHLDVRRDVFGHYTWAPGRKIDPSGPTPIYPSLGGVDGNRSWSDAAFADYVLGAKPKDPQKPTTPKSDIPPPTMRRGSRGPNVSALIDLLKQHRWYPAQYINDVNDGSFGSRSDSGVRTMQQAIGVGVDGIYGPVTAGALTEHLAAKPTSSGGPTEQTCSLPLPSKPGTSGASVRDLQIFLQANGWYRVRIDGDYGPLTAQGVQQFQRAVRAAGYDPGPIDGWYGAQSRAAGCRFVA